MKVQYKRNIVRPVAVVISVFMLWQSVVWADPEISSGRADHLQPRTLLFANDGEDAYLLTARWFIGYMMKAEKDQANLNIYRMAQKAREAAEEFARARASTNIRIPTPTVTEDPSKGEVVINGDKFRIRYFDPGVGAPEIVESPFRESEKKNLSNCLARQTIVHESVPPEGLIDQPDAEALAVARAAEELSKSPEAPPKNIIGRDVKPGFASLERIWQKIGVRGGLWTVFTIKPLFEDLAKVGVPMAALHGLKYLAWTSPMFSENIFKGILITFAVVFVLLHLLNKEEGEVPGSGIDFTTPASGARPSSLLGVLGAPIIVAAAGVGISIVYSASPLAAVSLSVVTHILVNLGVAALRAMGFDVGYAALEGPGKEDIVAQDAYDMIVKERFPTSAYTGIKDSLNNKYDINIDLPQYWQARMRMANVCAFREPDLAAESFEMFKISASDHPKAMGQIAGLCARGVKGMAAKYFAKFGFKLPDHKEQIVNVAMECAKHNGNSAAEYFKNFGLSAEEDFDAVSRIAFQAATNNGRGTTRHFAEFGLLPSRGDKERLAVRDVALAAMEQGASGTAEYFENFKFDPAIDKDFLIHIAEICARYSPLAAAKYFKKFGIDPKTDEEAVRRIVGICAGDIENAKYYFRNFGLDIRPDETDDFLAGARRKYLAELAGIIVKDRNKPPAGFVPSPLLLSLAENGETALTDIDKAFASLKHQFTTMAAKAYLKTLMLEQVSKGRGITSDFITHLNEEVIPALKAIEIITEDQPTMGIELSLPPDKTKWDRDMFRVIMSNYVATVGGSSKLAQSCLWQNEEGQIRVPPAPYPITRLLAAKMAALGLLDEQGCKVTVAGDHTEDGLLIFSALHFSENKDWRAENPGIIPKYPWVLKGSRDTTVDPTTGEIRKRDDPKTGGAHTKFLLRETQAPLVEKIEAIFALTSASAACRGKCGIVSEPLKREYEKFKTDVEGFLYGDLEIEQGTIDELSRDHGTYVPGLRKVQDVFKRIADLLKDNIKDDPVTRERKNELREDLRERVDTHVSKIYKIMISEKKSAAVSACLNGDFAGVKRIILEACYDADQDVAKDFRRLLRRTYEKDHAKMIYDEQALIRRLKGETTDKIKANAEKVMPNLRNALRAMADKGKGKKVVIALDMCATGWGVKKYEELANVLADLRRTDPELGKFCENLEIIVGLGDPLFQRLNNLTDEHYGTVDKQNVIVITTPFYYSTKYTSFAGKSTLIGVDKDNFPEYAYNPIIEVLLLSIGKHLGWNEEWLKEYYATIPNVTPFDKLSYPEKEAIFGADSKAFVIKLIPDAVAFDKDDLIRLLDIVKGILTKA